MSSLHKFKVLASQCAVVSGTPTHSPTTSPVIHLRRRKTLRMLLSRTPDHQYNRSRLPRRDDHRQSDLKKDPPEKKRVRRKLKDLFVSSPPLEDKENNNRSNNSQDDDGNLDSLPVVDNGGGGSVGGGFRGRFASRRVGGGLRPLSGTLRYRLLRRAWRPVLVTIPE
ncbi:uncharacterized protein LOC126677030 [Mercurialis annua]|uniref:uncharacterized protein LOC126677030 n=1 Tax=Mercurialis annua TaxID=3986 RepID=UPI00215F9077|nr:uncharacterized protein LOC126677030 [Mercurialis annua]